MLDSGKRFLVCNCERTMRIDGPALGGRIGEPNLIVHSHLCRSEIAAYERAIGGAGEWIVACTQESALFSEVAEERGLPPPGYVNIREMAGWTADKRDAGPKIAALLAAAALPKTPARLREVKSDGLCLVVGSGQSALDAAILLDRTLSVTLLLAGAEGILLPAELGFPVFCGNIVSARGGLGSFEIVVDGYAAMLPSSRREPQFAMPRDGAHSTCSVIFDMTGGAPLFSRSEDKDGYYRADPDNPAAIARALLDAGQMVGIFEKPIYVSYDASICAHERSRKTGCTKCIDNCPPGAITPAGDNIEVDSLICGGCGNCAAHCPTGAIAYEFPVRAQAIAHVQTLASTFLASGGDNPVLLMHDGGHGKPLINAMARLGRGLPAHIIPYEIHSATGIGHDLLLSALAAGFRSVEVLADPRKSAEFGAMTEEIALADALLSGLGAGGKRIRVLAESDPDTVENLLYETEPEPEIARATPVPLGGKREVARAAIAAVAERGTATGDALPLPKSAPYGTVHVDRDACTLCMACVSACPADALRDTPDKPQLRFVEAACVQCGICATTCPEKAIRLEARYLLTPAAMQPVTLNEDEPALCSKCGKPFATKKTLERIGEKLGGKHWMFQSPERISLIGMCDACRIEELSAGGRDPFAIARKTRMRTTDDYVEAKRKGISADDFFKEE